MLRSTVVIVAASVLLTITGSVPAAHAQSKQKQADALAVQAAKLGRAGKLAEAIARFKAAEALYPQAAYVCNIALAYVRLKRWAQAHLFLSSCRARWIRDESRPLPTWVDRRSRQALAKLQAGAFAAIRFSSTPAGATVSVSAFLPDETFTTPRVVWLPTGRHTVTATKAGFKKLEQPLDVKADGNNTIQLEAVPVVKPQPKPDPPPATKRPEPKPDPTPPVVRKPIVEPTPKPIPATRSRAVPALVTAAGIGLAVAGGITHVFAVRARDDAEAAQTDTAFMELRDRFRTRRMFTYGFYTAAIVATSIGAYLLLRGDRSSESAVKLGAGATASGGMVWVRWSN